MSKVVNTFTYKDVEYAIIKPTLEHNNEAQAVYNRAFADAVKSKALLREKLNDFMEEQGLWDENKQQQYKKLEQRIKEIEDILYSGGIKLSEAKELALELSDLRDEMSDLLSSRTRLDSNTAEGQADNRRFHYLISACLVYNDNGKPVFKDLEDYLFNEDDDKSEVALIGARKLAEYMYGLTEDFRSNLPEIKFLKEYGFMDDQMRLINKDGRLVDRQGRLIDDKNRFVDKDGKYVDSDGRPIDEEGNVITERKPFLDDETGEPVKPSKEEEKSSEEEKTNNNKSE